MKPGESVTENGMKHLIDKVRVSCQEKSDEICQLLSVASGYFLFSSLHSLCV